MGVTAGTGWKMMFQGELLGLLGSPQQRGTGVEYLDQIDKPGNLVHDFAFKCIRTEFIKRMLSAEKSSLGLDPLDTLLER